MYGPWKPSIPPVFPEGKKYLGGGGLLPAGSGGVAAGKSAAVAVTGAKNSTVKINSAMQTVNIPVTAGAKTVTVKIDGKIYTSKVTVK